MPELPEVETTARYLDERLRGSVIDSARVQWARTVHCPSVRQFCSQLAGSKVLSVGRRGKYIVMCLQHDKNQPQFFLLGHLRMSGSMEVVARNAVASSHDRVVFALRGGRELRFNDPRKFGRLYLVESPNVLLSGLGPEPLSSEYTVADLAKALAGRRSRIKPLLLDQTFLAGVGNIYADESLWCSRIHPLRIADSLKRDEVGRLYRSIRRILHTAIKYQGTDIGDSVVEYGNYSPRVYGREGAPCPRCRTKIQRMVVGQRGTHYCPNCQALSPRSR
ncbi:MAG: bifunctional DNA-formamidopyrimidine glycosylase/DNA-(apurinic or apyrimidinic site) lyase [Oligoflexia bacterium]|nr:bifunctional DNA-formamidopyrimidine glycosylase/DNA-(apurinic or apyrimidinic site) lyase [Oligoflexia bacterium]